MKYSSKLLILFSLFAFSQIFAQPPNVAPAKWNRIESDDKDFSIAFPPSAIVDAEERKYGQRLRVVAFQNGVQMDLVMIRDGDLKNRPRGVPANDLTRLNSAKVGDFSVLQVKPRATDRKFETVFWISKKDSLYILRLNAKTGQEAEVARFLFSISLDGKPLFVQKEKTALPEETIGFSALRTSPEVTEAFARKIERNKINVTYEASSNDLNEGDYDNLSRRVVVLERPSPSLAPGSFRSLNGSYTTRLKVNFLANGQIGDITVLSVENKDFSKACVEAARKIRFVPAQSGGGNVDSVEIVEYTAQIFSVPGAVVR